MLAVGLAVLLLPTLFSIFRQTKTVYAASFNVDTVVDEADGSCVDGDCSIRDAVAVAVGGDTILIPSGTYPLSETLGALVITKTLIFSGTGSTAADVVLQAGANSRLFAISGGTSTFFNLTLENGNPTTGNGGAINATTGASVIVNSSVITNNRTSSSGGGIAMANGSLTITNSQIMSNTAGNNGGGIFSNNGLVTFDNSQVLTNTAVNNGGGLSLNLAGANLIMNSGQIIGNQASMAALSFPGGGIHLAAASGTINGGEISNNLAHRGGGILVASGNLTINGGQIIDNEADYGGGVYVRQPAGAATINGGEITLNRSVDPASFGGGGLYIFQGLITMNGGEVSANSALNDGGGLEIGDPLGRFVQTGGDIFNNTAGNMGGGIYNAEGTLTVSGGSIFSNQATNGGGGIVTGSGSNSTISNSAILTNTAVGTSSGGGIRSSGTITLTNMTLSGNSAGIGAGLWNNGTAVLTNVTLSQNSASNNGGGLARSAGTLTVGNSIIFGNSAPLGADCNGTINSAGNNLSTCGLSGSGDSSSNPQLQPLALNSGSSLNYAIGSSSPAIDAGSNSSCPTTDQRGNLRPIDGNGDETATCDIGAYEFGIAFFINSATLTEGNSGSAQMSFVVSRSFITDTTYTVDYATADGTAVSGLDYTAVPTTTLTFLPATMTQTVTIDILGDTLDEVDEQFSVLLSNPSGEARLGNAVGTGTILDNDTAPTISINDVTIAEGSGGSTTAVFTATLSTASGKIITVNYAAQNGTAVADEDYTATSGSLTFNPGETQKTIPVTINPDSMDEDDETFTVVLSSPNNVTVADDTGQATITDDDNAPNMSIANVSVTEGNSGSKTMSFTVSLSAASSRTVTANYSTAAGSATAGTDYQNASGSLTFNPGDLTKTINVTINGDTTDEFNETFLVSLSGATNATIAGSPATGTITDDDAPPTATISSATAAEGDSGSKTMSFTVSLSAASQKTITINYSSANGTALAGEDFTAVPAATLTFNPGGSLSQIINVTVLGDGVTEPNEFFYINLTGSSNVTLANSQGTGTIVNDDGIFLYLPFVIKP